MQLQSVIDEMRSLNFDPPNFTPDGKVHRFRRNSQKENAWYIGWQNARLHSGEFYTIVIFGDWRTAEQHVIKPGKLSGVESRMIADQIKTNQEQLRKETEKVQAEIATEATRRFLSANKSGTTPYMTRKFIPDLYGCCLYLDRIQVPLRDIEGKIWGLQSISPDGEKFYMKGQRVDSCFHVIGKPLDSVSEAYLCEGLATASTVHQATEKTTVVCFDCHNLAKVAKALKARYPNMVLTICGDDDRKNEKNPGRHGAEKARLVCDGLLAFPLFPEGDLESTDFNDIHLKYGLKKVKDQFQEQPMEKKTGFIPLGYDESTHFFYDIGSKDIVKATGFTPVQMYNIAPLDYWEARYPGKKGGADLNQAVHDLIRNSREIGPFSTARVRGTGVWEDEGRVVINTGNSLIVDNKEMSLLSLKSSFFYIQTANRMPPLHPNPLTVKEMYALRECIFNLRWLEKEKAARLLTGWLAIARIAGGLAIRPHVWLTGGRGTGKSTVMENIIANALGSPKGKIYAQGGSTEAGIRQSLKSDSRPIIFDEFETNGRNREKINGIIELFRQAWSQTQGGILKGSATGLAVQYNIACCALVSSIRVSLDNDADISRFSVLELGPTDPREWKEMRALIAKITPEFGERFFARNCLQMTNIQKSYEVFQPILASMHGSRFGQQNGMLLAGDYSTISDEPVDEKTAAQIVSRCSWEEEKQEAEETDEWACLSHLLASRVRYDGEFSGEETVACILSSKGHGAVESLKSYGIMSDETNLFVANTHAQLSKIYANTRWSNWRKSLLRLPGATIKAGTRFSGVYSRSVSIPLAVVFRT